MEIAIVMVIIGLLTGAGISMMGMLTERKNRNETIDYLKQVKEALITYADINGRLPWADTDGDGAEDAANASGELPFLTLRVKPVDSNTRVVKYELNSNLGTDRETSCTALDTGLAGVPLVVDADGSTSSFPVAAIIVSAGPMDADGDGDVFDDIASGTHQGDNTNGAPNYIRHPPTDVFDDLVIYIGGYELYSGMECDELDLCSNSGVTVQNQYGSVLYFRKNGVGACNTWNMLSDETVMPTDTYEIFSDSVCTTPLSGAEYMYYTQQKQEDIDYDNDCLTSIVQVAGEGVFKDR